MLDFNLSGIFAAIDPWVILSFGGIFLIAGIVKGFLGIGLPAAAIGMLTLFLPPAEAIPLLWLPILGTNLFQFATAKNKRAIASEYAWFAVAIIITIFFTSMFIPDYPTAFLTVAIGIAMVIFSLNLLFGLKLPVGAGRGWQIGIGSAAGILGGLSSIWSPVVAMYLVARDTPKDKFIGATGFLFLAGAVPLGAGQFIAGLITGAVLIKSAVFFCVVIVGFRIGEFLRNRVSHEQFRKVILVAFLIMGIRMIATGLL